MPTTPEQQLALELINLARSDPAGQYDLLILGSFAGGCEILR